MKLMYNKTLPILFWILWISASAQTMTFESVTEVKALKRGKEHSIKWSGGRNDQNVKIELVNNQNVAVQHWENVENDGELTLKLNSKLKPAKDYHFKIETTGSDAKSVNSQPISIRRRIPLALTISAIVIIPTVIIIVQATRPEEKNIKEPIPPSTLP